MLYSQCKLGHSYTSGIRTMHSIHPLSLHCVHIMYCTGTALYCLNGTFSHEETGISAPVLLDSSLFSGGHLLSHGSWRWKAHSDTMLWLFGGVNHASSWLWFLRWLSSCLFMSSIFMSTPRVVCAPDFNIHINTPICYQNIQWGVKMDLWKNDTSKLSFNASKKWKAKISPHRLQYWSYYHQW